MNLVSPLVALAWMVPFLMGGTVRPGPSSQRSWISAAGGMAVAYVFLDLLPEMQRMQEAFSAASTTRAFLFPHYRVYTSALAGFVLFYALEHMVVTSRPEGRARSESERPGIYWVQVVGFAVYCGLMAYVLRADADTRMLSTLLYGFAMLCHFWIVDRSLRKEHGARYVASGHWVPCLGILAGWTIAAAGFASDLVVPTLMGFIAGGVVLNSVKGELPGEGEGRPIPVIAGASGYAILLLLVG